MSDLRCGECGQANAACLITFTRTSVIDYPVCTDCLADIGKRYKSTWANTQICIERIKPMRGRWYLRIWKWLRSKLNV